MIYPVERPTWLMKAQQMSNVARNLLHIPRTAPVAYIVEPDLLQHIEDEQLYWVYRNGQHIQLTWNELTEMEREHQREAQHRAEQCILFHIYD